MENFFKEQRLIWLAGETPTEKQPPKQETQPPSVEGDKDFKDKVKNNPDTKSVEDAKNKAKEEAGNKSKEVEAEGAKTEKDAQAKEKILKTQAKLSALQKDLKSPEAQSIIGAINQKFNSADVYSELNAALVSAWDAEKALLVKQGASADKAGDEVMRVFLRHEFAPSGRVFLKVEKGSGPKEAGLKEDKNKEQTPKNKSEANPSEGQEKAENDEIFDKRLDAVLAVLEKFMTDPNMGEKPMDAETLQQMSDAQALNIEGASAEQIDRVYFRFYELVSKTEVGKENLKTVPSPNEVKSLNKDAKLLALRQLEQIPTIEAARGAVPNLNNLKPAGKSGAENKDKGSDRAEKVSALKSELAKAKGELKAPEAKVEMDNLEKSLVGDKFDISDLQNRLQKISEIETKYLTEQKEKGEKVDPAKAAEIFKPVLNALKQVAESQKSQSQAPQESQDQLNPALDKLAIAIAAIIAQFQMFMDRINAGLKPPQGPEKPEKPEEPKGPKGKETPPTTPPEGPKTPEGSPEKPTEKLDPKLVKNPKEQAEIETKDLKNKEAKLNEIKIQIKNLQGDENAQQRQRATEELSRQEKVVNDQKKYVEALNIEYKERHDKVENMWRKAVNESGLDGKERVVKEVYLSGDEIKIDLHQDASLIKEMEPIRKLQAAGAEGNLSGIMEIDVKPELFHSAEGAKILELLAKLATVIMPKQETPSAA